MIVSRSARRGAVGRMPTPTAAPVHESETSAATDVDRPWLTVVWDDPVNLMSYVTYVFQTVLGKSRAEAHDLMLKVHNEGRAVVSSGSRDKVEIDVRRLQQAGLWATMQRES